MPSDRMKQLAQESLDVQDACNLSGVVHGFSRAMTALREENPSKGTDWLNEHPICCLWSDKIASLTKTQAYGGSGGARTMKAYDLVHKLAKGEDIEY